MDSDLSQYQYDLPNDRIAKHPLDQRDASKLLIYKEGEITHKRFSDALDYLPSGSTIFFNNTKVIAARLYFFKPTGAKIEVFLTEPMAPFTDFQQAFGATKSCMWKCIIGNLKKWKDGEVLSMKMDQTHLTASLEDRGNNLVRFEWEDQVPFLEIVEQAGHVPLPPYLNREEESEDKDRYQTVFSKLEGAVAAPTAGLHFTEEVLKEIDTCGILRDELTLHVSAGTFRPIKTEKFTDHDMHNEKIIIRKQNIENLLAAPGPIFCVGTTALRTLESLYWYAVKLTENPEATFKIEKEDPYLRPNAPSRSEALQALLEKFDRESVNELHGETEIFVYPGYDIKIVDGLFTNFHMPGSTLILLVAAFVGEDWKKIYDEALDNNYRFLSYGDTSLLFRNKNGKLVNPSSKRAVIKDIS